ncbi:MAG: GntR family transcriptional regulator [Eubacteriales bacterium]|nr:GntR family transcriptional regulator [Clostridiales bacterium]MDY5836405.1 GntR family transcriptional regulator [Eubacteriales bacterium]
MPEHKGILYQQIYEDLLAKILSRSYLPGSAIPSEYELAATYGVSRPTVRKSISLLESQGMVKTIQGKGAFVLGKQESQIVEELQGFSRRLSDTGKAEKVTLIGCSRRAAGILFADIFQIAGTAEIYIVRRLVSNQESPLALELWYIPLDAFPALPQLNVTDFSLYELCAFYDLSIRRVEQSLEIVSLEKSDARLLGITTQDSVFRFDSLGYTDQGCLSYVVTYVRSDKSDFQVYFQNT